MRKYRAGYLVLAILAFICWILIIFGVIMILTGIVNMADMRSRMFINNMLAGGIFSTGVMFVVIGLIGLALDQLGRAVFDSAEINQLQLKVARDQLEVSRQALKQGDRFEQGYAARHAAKEELLGAPGEAPPKASFADRKSIAHKPGDTIEYKGKEIRLVEAGYVFGGTVFSTVEEAYAHIDEDDFALNSRQPGNRPYADQLGVNRGPTLGGVTRR